MKGKTCIVIAHHLATIRHADGILVLKDSGVVEQGTYEELLSLYQIQENSETKLERRFGRG